MWEETREVNSKVSIWKRKISEMTSIFLIFSLDRMIQLRLLLQESLTLTIIVKFFNLKSDGVTQQGFRL